MKKMNSFCGNQGPLEWKYWMTLHATWTELNSNTMNGIWVQFNNWIKIQFNSNSIKKKWDAN